MIAVLLIVCGYVEFLFRDFWLTITNGYNFWHFDELKATQSGAWEAEMRATGNVPVDLLDRFRFSFLNTPLLEDFGLSTILRIFGPNMSPISFGYGIGFSQQRNEDNEKDGQKRQTTEIVAYRMDVNQRQEEPALG